MAHQFGYAVRFIQILNDMARRYTHNCEQPKGGLWLTNTGEQNDQIGKALKENRREHTLLDMLHPITLCDAWRSMSAGGGIRWKVCV